MAVKEEVNPPENFDLEQQEQKEAKQEKDMIESLIQDEAEKSNSNSYLNFVPDDKVDEPNGFVSKYFPEPEKTPETFNQNSIDSADVEMGIE